MNCNELLSNHKKFFAQAKDSVFLKEHMLNNLPTLDERVTKVLQNQAIEYFEKIARRNKIKGQKKPVKWDFGGSGDHKKMLDSKKQPSMQN